MVTTKKKKVVVACGTGIATSTVVSDKIVEACKKEGIGVEVAQCKVTELRGYIDGADLIVTTTILRGDFNIPVVSGLPFITGLGESEAIKSILKELKK